MAFNPIQAIQPFGALTVTGGERVKRKQYTPAAYTGGVTQTGGNIGVTSASMAYQSANRVADENGNQIAYTNPQGYVGLAQTPTPSNGQPATKLRELGIA